MGRKRVRITIQTPSKIIMMNTLTTLDYWTNIALDAIWKEQVELCIQYDNTGKTDNNTENTTFTNDWELIEHTPFTEPIWGITVNRN